VSRIFSQLSGGLDQHIEHHLFPTLPPERLREIAPKVREICERHGITYKSAPWPKVVRNVLATFSTLRRSSSEHEDEHENDTFGAESQMLKN
jgi:linoleoyl-CoA desaturase